MAKVIIGIHGLANKPPKETLKHGWEHSIHEGLANVGADSASLNFELVYWANYLYRNQLHREEGFDFDKLYNDEPYIPAKPGALEEHDDGWKDKLRGFAGDVLGSGLDWAKRSFDIDGLANAVLRKKLKDLDFYYAERNVNVPGVGARSAKAVFREELEAVLMAHQQDDVMLIAHSMGSIIAYDVLRNLGRNHPGSKVAHFVTIGSPLGLPHVKNQIVKDRTEEGYERAKEVRTPSVITKSWTNFADPLDPVSLDSHLRDDYKANENGVRVKDDIVVNDYEGESGKRNHHKSYGYLRTPELSKHIASFLAG